MKVTCDAPLPKAGLVLEVEIVISDTWSSSSRFGEKSTALVRMKLSWILMPSSVMLVNEVRCPLMTLSPARPLDTPAIAVTSDNGLRLSIGRSLIWARLMFCATSALVVCTTDR
jgi:hypothetical protein